MFICGDRNNSQVAPFFETLFRYPNHFEELKLAWSNAPEVRNITNCNYTEERPYNIFLFKTFDEEQLEYTGVHNRTILDTWVSTYTTPIIMDLNDDNIQLVFKEKIPALIYIYNHSDIFDANSIAEIKDTWDPFYRLGNKYRVRFFSF